MLPEEIARKVKGIELRTKRLVNDVFSGEYHSVFKGRGIEFAEVREYGVGDDVRMIDWNVTARMGHPYVKTFDEERELTVMLGRRCVRQWNVRQQGIIQGGAGR